jgi:hypothetical protein
MARVDRLSWRALLCATPMALSAACGTDEGTDCNVICMNLPQTNACKVVHGNLLCVMLCTTDEDCNLDLYAGCIDQADDGTKLCGGSARDRDAGADDSG